MSVTTTRAAQAVTEWTKVFPKQVTETFTSSVTFMKQLTKVAISTITYLKNVFPEDNYNTENFAGLKLKILKNSCRDELAQFVANALAQAFDAFEKKYLHKLALCFYEGECLAQNLIEYYIFEFAYSPDGVTLDIKSKDNVMKCSLDNVKEQTVILIRTCICMMESFNTELPETYDISLRLYYNDDTPENYQAPGFLPSTETEDHLAPTISSSMKMGVVNTPFHKLKARSYFKDVNTDNMDSSRDANPSQNAPMIESQNALDFEDAVGDYSVSSDPTVLVVCPCNKTDMDEDTPLLTCNHCGYISHGPCYGVRAVSAAHVCVRCSDVNPQLAPQDERLATLPYKKRECICIFRRALWWLKSKQDVSVTSLAEKFSLSQVTACKLMKLLNSSRILVLDTDDDDLVTPRKINHDQLKQVMSLNFRNEESNIVDRLLAETLTEERPDPVGQVLAPMEKVSLHNATAMAKVIEHTPPNTDTEDYTLRQYREAILSNETVEDDMPLSGKHNPVKDIEKIRKKTVKRKADDKSKAKTGVKSRRVSKN